MTRRRVLVAGLVIGMLALFSVPSARAAENASESFARGNALVASGNLHEAYAAFMAAAKMAPDNMEYRQQFALVRRVIQMEKALTAAPDAEDWVATAQGVRTFYANLGLYQSMLSLDQQIHERAKSADSAAALADTQLALGMNEETVSLLAALPEAQQSATTRALLGIAYTRLGNDAAARELAHNITPTENAGADELYAIARLNALLGSDAPAIATLTRSFEATHPMRLEAAKKAAKDSPDFARLAGSAPFVAALATESKVKVSSCSGGSSCGKCPSAASCAKSGATHTGDEKPCDKDQ